jgi:hypothetical protein
MSNLALEFRSSVKLANKSKLSSAEYDAIFEERQRKFARYAAENLHRAPKHAVPIINPMGHEQTGYRKGKGAIGVEKNGVLRNVVVLSDGFRRHRTVPTHIGLFGHLIAGRAYASSAAGLHGTPPEGGADQNSAST